MSRFEVYSPEGLRIDGRRWNEVRAFDCAINTHPKSSDGSSFVELGGTKVLCSVEGPKEPESRNKQDVDKCTVSVSITVAAFAGVERKKRPRNDRRVQEMCTILQHTFEDAILTHLYPRTEVVIQLHILSNDGSMFACCVNAVTLALIDGGVPMYDYVSAVSVALYDGQVPLLDASHLEEQDLSAVTMATIGKSDKICALLVEDRVPLDRLELLLATGISGCNGFRDLMDREVRKHGRKRLQASADNS